MRVQEIDVDDDVLLRAFWEAGREGDAYGRDYSTFWAWTAAKVAFRATANSVSQHAIAAIESDQVLGASQVILPLLDNQHVAYVEPIVRPAHRRRGVGTALLGASIDLAREHGRTTLIGEVNQPLDGEDCPGRRFMAAHGFTEASEEIHRVLDLPVPEELMESLDAATAGHHDDYRIVTWDDQVPDEYLDGFCLLQSAFNAEAPMGELNLEPEEWDATRVRRAEERMAKQGRREAAAAALDPAGQMAALTQLVQVAESPHWGAQGGTLVMPQHRGRRLGTAIKVANLRRYQARFPHVQVVHAWNAEVNSPMVAINEALGFRPVERMLEMQRTL